MMKMKKLFTVFTAAVMLFSMVNLTAFAAGKDAGFEGNQVALLNAYLDEHGREVSVEQLYADQNKAISAGNHELAAALAQLDTMLTGKYSYVDKVSIPINTPVRYADFGQYYYLYLSDKGTARVYSEDELSNYVAGIPQNNDAGRSVAVKTAIQTYETLTNPNFTPTSKMSATAYYKLFDFAYFDSNYNSTTAATVRENLGKIYKLGLSNRGALTSRQEEDLTRWTTNAIYETKTPSNWIDLSVKMDAKEWLNLYDYMVSSGRVVDREAVSEVLSDVMGNGLVGIEKLTTSEKGQLNSLREQYQESSDHPGRYIFNVAGEPMYSAQTGKVYIQYETWINGRLVMKDETIDASKIAGFLQAGGDNTVAGQRILADFADRYGKLLNLEEGTLGYGANAAGTNEKISLRGIVQMWEEGSLCDHIKNENVMTVLCTAYRKGTVPDALKNKVSEMLLSTVDSDGIRVVNLGDNFYLAEGYSYVMNGDQVAAALADDFLSARYISKTDISALDSIWTNGLYDNLSEDARAAFNKRMSEVMDSNTNVYRFSNGQTWVRPGSGYSVLPFDVFSNIVNGMSLSKLKEWKSNGTYDGLTDVQKKYIDSQIGSREAREAQATSAAIISGVAGVVKGVVGAVSTVLTDPLKAVKSAMSKAQSFVKKLAEQAKATAKATAQAATSVVKSWTLSLGSGAKTVSARTYQEALDAVTGSEKSAGESAARRLDANFSSEARSYVQALKEAAEAAARAAASVASVTGTSSSSGSSSSSSGSGSSSRPKPTTTSNIITTAITVVTTVVSAVTAGIKAISSLFGKK